MFSLRTKFMLMIALLLAASVALQLLAIRSAQSSIAGDGTFTQPSLAVPTVLSTLATFCVAAAVVLVVGVVAMAVIDEAFVRRLEIDADAEGGPSDEGDGIPAYGTDPERL